MRSLQDLTRSAFWKMAIPTARVCNQAYLKQDQQDPCLPSSALWSLCVNFDFFWIAVVIVARRWSFRTLQRGCSWEASCQAWLVRKPQPSGQVAPSSFVLQSRLWPNRKAPHPFCTRVPRAHVHGGGGAALPSVGSPGPQVHRRFEDRPCGSGGVRGVSCQTNTGCLFTHQCFPLDRELLRADTVMSVFKHIARHMIAIELSSEWLNGTKTASLFQNILFPAGFETHSVTQEVSPDVTCFLSPSWPCKCPQH